jgi:hypothetical protein
MLKSDSVGTFFARGYKYRLLVDLADGENNIIKAGTELHFVSSSFAPHYDEFWISFLEASFMTIDMSDFEKKWK